MLHEAREQLVRRHGDALAVFGAEGDAAVVHRNESPIGDTDAVSVSPVWADAVDGANRATRLPTLRGEDQWKRRRPPQEVVVCGSCPGDGGLSGAELARLWGCSRAEMYEGAGARVPLAPPGVFVEKGVADG